ncbi:hypothetical protein FS837_003158, partial [Tulasnella sp. UAMH 9824]
MVNGDVSEYLKREDVDVTKRLDISNVLITDTLRTVLCDFGLSSFMEESTSGLTTSRSFKDALRYMSPELLLEDEKKHTLESDVWAWGCTAFEIMTGCRPYREADRASTVLIAVMKNEPPGSAESLMVQLGDETPLGTQPAL